MTCLKCGSAHQRGRFCNRCGSKRPPTAASATAWTVRPKASRPRSAAESTSSAPTRPPAAPRGGAGRPADPDPVTIRSLYDKALARETVGERPLDRYLSVLLGNPGPA